MADVAIVTGADSGIGKASAVALAEAGFDVGITFHSDEAGADGTAAEVRAAGQRAEVRRLDLSDPTTGPGVVDDLTDSLGGLSALVNNAATGAQAPFLDLEYDAWRSTLAVDLDGAFTCAQAAARRMVADGTRGSIVNVTSVHEHVPLEGSSAYCAAKGGLGLLTKVMALELAAHGIRVNSLAPGEIATPMTGAEDVDPRTLERPWIPLGRPGHAREMASVVVFLASPASSYVTGSSFVADGGLLLMSAVPNSRSES